MHEATYESTSRDFFCPSCRESAEGGGRRYVRAGFYRRRGEKNPVQRFKCLDCKLRFSTASNTLEYGQRRRDVNQALFDSLSSLVSLRRTAELARVDRKTVARRLPFFEKLSEIVHEKFLDYLVKENRRSTHIQFDDMETSEHTKLKPVAISLVVTQKERFVLSLDVASMPAKGPLAALSRKKYGPRKDDRPAAWAGVLSRVSRMTVPGAIITTDMHTRYPELIRSNLPDLKHVTCKGRKACVAGQGELKKGGRDPLFAVNHTAAMFRANVNRLIRRTWCTTKRIDRLRCHLWIYILRHNMKIDEKLRKKSCVKKKSTNIDASVA